MTDRFSMAYAIEARTPFLDIEFSEFIYSIPFELRTSDPNLKYLFIDAVRDWLPDEVVAGSKKGFTLPLSTWLKNQLREKVEYFLSEKFIREQNIFQPTIYDTIAKPFYTGQQSSDWKLWELLMFQMWYKKFFS
jgi:asparagine synthase (glutamine-hydrolysing)